MESVREILEGQKMEVILQLNHDLAEARRIIRELIRFAGGRGFCARCGEVVFYVSAASRRQTLPYDEDGSRHRDRCPGKFPEETNHE